MPKIQHICTSLERTQHVAGRKTLAALPQRLDLCQQLSMRRRDVLPLLRQLYLLLLLSAA